MGAARQQTAYFEELAPQTVKKLSFLRAANLTYLTLYKSEAFGDKRTTLTRADVTDKSFGSRHQFLLILR